MQFRLKRLSCIILSALMTLSFLPSVFDLKNFILEHIKHLDGYYSPRRSVLEFRKFISYYFKGIAGLKDIKTAIYTSEDFNEISNLICQAL